MPTTTDCYRLEPPGFNSSACHTDDATGHQISGHVLCSCDRCKAEAHYRDDVWFYDRTGTWHRVKSPWVKGKIPAWLAHFVEHEPFTSLRPIGTGGRGKPRFWAHVHALSEVRQPDANTLFVARFLGGLTANGEMARGLAFIEGVPALLKLAAEFGAASVNAADWQGFPARTLRVNDVGAKSTYEKSGTDGGLIAYWTISVEIEYNRLKWNPTKVRDRGDVERVIQDGVARYRQIKSDGGDPMIADLNGAGQRLPAGADPVWLVFNLYPQIDFAANFF